LLFADQPVGHIRDGLFKVRPYSAGILSSGRTRVNSENVGQSDTSVLDGFDAASNPFALWALHC
jgi:hypothetical protein